MSPATRMLGYGWALALSCGAAAAQDTPEALLDEAYNTAYNSDDAAAMQSILKRGLDVNARHGQDHTMLMYATSKGNLAVAKVLVDAGADLELRSEVGHTALRSVTWTGDRPVESVKFLIDAGANVNDTSDDNWTPLIQAMYDTEDGVAMGKLLIAAGTDVNVVNNEGNTALIVAASRKQLAIIPDLLKAGADGSVIGGDGTALFEAVDDGEVDVAKALLEGGVDPDIGDDDGKTPLIEAAMSGNAALVELLLAHCARTDLRDGFFEKTAAELANSSEVKAALAAGVPATCAKR